MQAQSPGREDSPGGGNGNPLQYSCLEDAMDRETWQAKESDMTERARARAHTHTYTHTHTHSIYKNARYECFH